METPTVANLDAPVRAALSPSLEASAIATTEAVRGEHGFINVAMLESIVNTLLQTENEDDAHLGDWLNANYIKPPIGPGEQSREITSDGDFHNIHTAYQRAQSLTGRTVPEKFPFFATHLKEMSRAKVKEKARSSASSASAKVEEHSSTANRDITVTGAVEQSSITKKISNESTQAVEASPPSKTDVSSFMMTIENESPMTAAHSDPITTNLDMRPPSAHNNNKRKSTTPAGGSKKTTRTSYRGRGAGRGRGRARGGRFAISAREDEEIEDDEEEEVGPDLTLTEGHDRVEDEVHGERVKKPMKKTSRIPKPKVDAPPARTTRSKTQKSSSNLMPETYDADPTLVGATHQYLESPDTPHVAAVSEKRLSALNLPVTFPTPSRLSVDSVIPTPSEYLSEGPTGSFNGRNGTPQVSPLTAPREDSFVGSAFSKSNTERLTTSSPAVADPSDSLDIGQVSSINFFARVQTSKGLVEIPISQDTFTGDSEVIKRYAVWKQQEEGMDLSFEQFVKISAFANKS